MKSERGRDTGFKYTSPSVFQLLKKCTDVTVNGRWASTNVECRNPPPRRGRPRDFQARPLPLILSTKRAAAARKCPPRHNRISSTFARPFSSSRRRSHFPESFPEPFRGAARGTVSNLDGEDVRRKRFETNDVPCIQIDLISRKRTPFLLGSRVRL